MGGESFGIRYIWKLYNLVNVGLEVIFTLKCFICLFFFGKITYIHLKSKRVKDRNLMTDTSILEDLNDLKSFFFLLS